MASGIDPDELKGLSEEDLRELDRYLMEQGGLWLPQPGPQTTAYESEADIIGFGGSAGGGKTELAIGFSLTQHRRVGIFRQTGTELTAIVDRIEEILGARKGYNGTERIWRMNRHDGEPLQIEFGSFPDPGDERKYRGRPHDLLVFDEAQDMREEAVRFLLAWLRTTHHGQRCRALLTFNPPTSAEGRWVISFFAPWIDDKHPNPAEPGELRWFVSMDGADQEVDGPEPFEKNGETVTPLSRTFIPSKVVDNVYLRDSGYVAQLQAIKDPTLRAQLLHGDFRAGLEDDAFQVIPTDWVDAAMERWEQRLEKKEMHSLGVDVAMGGRDQTVIARRHDRWFDEPIVYSGKECIDGPTIGGFVMAALRDQAVIHIDLLGTGAAPFGHLSRLQQQVIGVNMGDPAYGLDESGRIGFFNIRSQIWWRMREVLDPNVPRPISLPPSRELLSDLTAPCWELKGQKIKVESRDDLVKKLGRSPDMGTAYCLALMDTPKLHTLISLGSRRKEWDPYENL